MRPGIIDARARYRAAARLLRNTDVENTKYCNRIKIRKIERPGHLVRRSDNRTLKKVRVFPRKPGGRRTAGRPK